MPFWKKNYNWAKKKISKKQQNAFMDVFHKLQELKENERSGAEKLQANGSMEAVQGTIDQGQGGEV